MIRPFNPFCSNAVKEIETKTAEMIDLVAKYGSDPRLTALAQTNFEIASMIAVKAASYLPGGYAPSIKTETAPNSDESTELPPAPEQTGAEGNTQTEPNPEPQQDKDFDASILRMLSNSLSQIGADVQDAKAHNQNTANATKIMCSIMHCQGGAGTSYVNTAQTACEIAMLIDANIRRQEIKDMLQEENQ